MGSIREKYCPQCFDVLFRKKDFEFKMRSIHSNIHSKKEDYIDSVEDILLISNAPLDLLMKVRNTVKRELFNHSQINEVITQTLQDINFQGCCFSCGYVQNEQPTKLNKKKEFFRLGIKKLLKI